MGGGGGAGVGKVGEKGAVACSERVDVSYLNFLRFKRNRDLCMQGWGGGGSEALSYYR